MKIQLKCATGGYEFGDIVDIESKDCDIDAKTANTLVKDDLALEVFNVVASGSAELKSENAELKGQLKLLQDKLNEGGDGSDNKLVTLQDAIKDVLTIDGNAKTIKAGIRTLVEGFENG